MRAGRLSLPINSTTTPGANEMQNPPINPMHKAHAAPRCLAMTRTGTACQSPAIKGRNRCRMHGGRGSGAPKGNRNAWKHGARSGSTLEALALIRALGKALDGGPLQ